MSTGLIYISANALQSQPGDPAALAVSDYLNEAGEQLHMYECLQHGSQREPPGTALSVMRNSSITSKEAFQRKLNALPPLSRDKIDDISTLQNESSEMQSRYDLPVSDENHLPQELIAQAMDDGLPESDPNDAIQDTDHGLEVLVNLKQSPDFDPNIPADALDNQAMVKDTLETYDRVNMKNCDNWDPEQDP